MSTNDILQHLKSMSNSERLLVIETATRLVRGDVVEERRRRMERAAQALKDLYEPGGAQSEWTSLDAEEILDDHAPR